MKATERMVVWAVAVLALLLAAGRDEAVQLAQRLCEQPGYCCDTVYLTGCPLTLEAVS